MARNCLNYENYGKVPAKGFVPFSQVCWKCFDHELSWEFYRTAFFQNI